MSTPNNISQYMAQIGRAGGKKSRRRLDSATARMMTTVREAKRLFRQYHAQCFWSFSPNLRITARDVPWVAAQLQQHGNRVLWQKGKALCR